MSTCSFCKSAAPASGTSCPSCGRDGRDGSFAGLAPGHTLSAFDDDDGGDVLELQKGSAIATSVDPGAYAGTGMMFDTGFDDDPSASLELDVAPRAITQGVATRPESEPPLGAENGTAEARNMNSVIPPGAGLGCTPSDPPPLTFGPSREAGLMLARYPAPPLHLKDAPLYACRVLWRQIELRRELESLRRKRSPDVALFETALRVHDPRAFKLGLLLAGGAFAVLTLLFFTPVIARFCLGPR